ncbi:MAG TPA: hypothetical protein VH186_20610 [Chloroflexia bacterium]|nr:hypothetical protein [Chloroflexia bacterium]
MVEVKPGAKPVPVVGYTRALELYATSYLEEPDFFRGVRRHRLTYPANAKVVSASSPGREAQPAAQGSTSTSTASSKVEVEL